MSEHPSLLALDRFALDRKDPAVAAHVAACARCADHLQRVAEPPPPPPWLRGLEQPGGKRPRAISWWHRWSLVCAGVLAVGGGAFLLRGREPLDVGAKGMPSIAVYIKRGDAVSLWDGASAVRAGDAVQLKIAATGYARVTVAAAGVGDLTELYAGPAASDGLIPQSWTIDDAPGSEVLLVAFSQSPLSKDRQEAALATLPRTREIWATRLELSKRGTTR